MDPAEPPSDCGETRPERDAVGGGSDAANQRTVSRGPTIPSRSRYRKSCRSPRQCGTWATNCGCTRSWGFASTCPTTSVASTGRMRRGNCCRICWKAVSTGRCRPPPGCRNRRCRPFGARCSTRASACCWTKRRRVRRPIIVVGRAPGGSTVPVVGRGSGTLA